GDARSQERAGENGQDQVATIHGRWPGTERRLDRLLAAVSVLDGSKPVSRKNQVPAASDNGPYVRFDSSTSSAAARADLFRNPALIGPVYPSRSIDSPELSADER